MNIRTKKILKVLLVIFIVIAIILWLIFGYYLSILKRTEQLLIKVEQITVPIDYSSIEVNRPIPSTLNTLITKCDNANISIFVDSIMYKSLLSSFSNQISEVTFTSEEVTKLINILLNLDVNDVLNLPEYNNKGDEIAGLRIINSAKLNALIKPNLSNLYDQNVSVLLENNLLIYSQCSFNYLNNDYTLVTDKSINNLTNQESIDVAEILNYFSKTTIYDYSDYTIKYSLSTLRAFAEKLNANISFSNNGMTLSPKE